MTDWNPDRYLDFADERARPAIDLIAHVPLQRPRLVYDLGCGPGNSTSLLKHAYPSARVIGIDRSPAMIAKAKETYGALEFHSADVALWPADKEADLIFANALFQWVPSHLQHLQRIIHGMKRSAVLAIQMPDNLAEPSHMLMLEVAEQGAWAGQLSRAVSQRSPLHSPTEYYDALRPDCASVDIWRTTYLHALDGTEGIVKMLFTTGLKPYLDLLRDTDQAEYLDRYRAALPRHYPPAADGKVLFAFPRLFIVARK